MDSDFHYLGTGTAAIQSGFDSTDAQVIAFSAQFIDWFDSDYWSYWQIVSESGRDVKDSLGQPYRYDTPQLTVQSINPKAAFDFDKDIWTPFHFPPGNIDYELSKTDRATPWKQQFKEGWEERKTRKKYAGDAFKLCRPYSKFALDLITDTVKQFKALSNAGSELESYVKEAIGNRHRCPISDGRKLALYFLGARMHIFVDTWAHQDFIGEQHTINSAGEGNQVEIQNRKGEYEKAEWVGAIWSGLVQRTDCSRAPEYHDGVDMVCPGHGQLGSLPDFSWLTYRYPAAWQKANAKPLVRDNPSEFIKAWKWMAFVLGLCNETKSDQDAPDATPREIEKVLKTHHKRSDSGLEAFQSSEKKWEATALAKKFVNPVFNTFGAHDWPQLDKEKLGLKGGAAWTRFGTINVVRDSVLHYMETAAAMHYKFYYDWVRKNREYRGLDPRKPMT